MKIYCAGKWTDRLQIRELMTKLESMGHTITRDWTVHANVDNKYIDLDLRRYAVEDAQGVADADILIAQVLDEHHYRGMWVEVGMALGQHKTVILVGNAGNSCIFSHHPLVIKLGSLEELYAYLTPMEGK
jgi:hypothetical protein